MVDIRRLFAKPPVLWRMAAKPSFPKAGPAAYTWCGALKQSLQSWRATLIPIVAVPISLIGTFGFMLIFGFSLNILTLLGLILAIGIVVDDAIVVVEGVEHIMETEHLSPYEATKKAMNGLASALIATSLVLAAVFVPVSFLSGITGQLYRQFTVTIVVSVLISTVVALTLSPVMCSLILKPDSGKKKNIIFLP